MAGNKYISVKKARVHNLKNVSVDIPRNSLTVVTGVSGSGKSSLAFNTVYAEGQRRFVESLSAYARQFLERMAKPDVDSIEGLPPAIAIEQSPPQKNPRSTVGTSTEVYDYLRILYGRIAKTYCRGCGRQVTKDTPSSVAGLVSRFNEGDKFYILFRPEPGKSKISEYLDLGFFRWVSDETDEIENLEEKDLSNGFESDEGWLLADRLSKKNNDEFASRLVDSLETAFASGNGNIAVRNLESNEQLLFSSRYECAYCNILYHEPEPKLFSFNNPFGVCPACQGFGRTIGIDENLVVPDKSRSLRQGAIHPFRTQGKSNLLTGLIRAAAEEGIPVDKPFGSLSDEHVRMIWEGFKGFKGINDFFRKLEDKNYKVQNRIMISRYRGYTNCHACGGSRLRTSARQAYVGGKKIPSLIKMPLQELLDFVEGLELNEYEKKVAEQVLAELKWRLQLLVDIGLEYLTLDRLSHTLSGGEAQRINLSTALGSSLVGTLYVLDEPSIGMHPTDNEKLMKILFKMRNLGNTVIVVEHDLDIIRLADYVIDIGPGAGETGGEIVFRGKPESLLRSKNSITGSYLSGRKKIEFPKEFSSGNGKKISIINASENNLNISSLDIPLACMTVVTGVSGSGKSTLVHDVLYAGVKKQIGGYSGHVGKFEKITGADNILHAEMVDQSPIGRSSRSTPATYIKAFDAIRDLFSQTQLSRQMGWKPGHFSFNVPGGRCESCEGEGYTTVDMQFLPDVTLVCESCHGTRYKREVRNLLFNGKSVVDVLSMTVDEAMEFFKEHSRIVKKLKPLHDTGLGYLRLGQPSTELSGGEAQRIKLANHLDTFRDSGVLFIFDEPTTGLHIDDVSKLLECLRRLTEQGHSVLVIEHNLHVIASADHVIDLGPGAGNKGGRVVACGTPPEIADSHESKTGNALKEFYRRNS